MASGDTLLVFTPLSTELPVSNYAQIGNRNNHPTVDFDSTTQETIFFTGILPRHYGNGGVTVTIAWVTNAVSGNIQFLGSFEIMSDATTDTDADSFAATQSTGTLTVPGTSGVVATQTMAFTNGAQMDSVVAGSTFRFRLQRDPATDTAANDAQLYSVEIKET